MSLVHAYEVTTPASQPIVHFDCHKVLTENTVSIYDRRGITIMTGTTQTRDFYTIPELTIETHLSRPAIYQWCKKGWLTSYKIGGQRRVSKSEWQKFLNRGKVA